MQHSLSSAGEPGRGLLRHDIRPEAERGAAGPFGVVLGLVSRRYGVPMTLLLHPSRCMAPAARARQLAMYLSHVVLGRHMSEVGAAFGRDRTTVAYACAKIEDARDNPRTDAELGELEREIEALLAREGAADGAL